MSIPELPVSLNQTQNGDLPLARTLWALPSDSAAQSDDLQWALDEFAARRPWYDLYNAYLAGNHRLLVATQAYEIAFRALLDRTRANVCPAVVRALTDRLRVVGFSPHAEDGSEAVAAAAWQLWQERRLPRLANFVHGQAAGIGDAAVLVWPDKAGDVQFYGHRGDQLVCGYDAEMPDKVTRAAKLWRDGDRYRLTLYYADRLERYATAPNTRTLPDKSAAFGAYNEAGEPWLVRHDYGRVPVVPFPFEGGPGQPGKSMLAEVVPLQDQLNKSIIDREVAAEFAAFPQRYAIGLEPDYDENGNPLPLPFKAGIDRLLTIANPDGKFGQFEAADLTAYTNKIESTLDLIAAVTGIPPHLLHRGMGTPPSGEALKTAETRLVARVEDTQTDFGDAWEDVLGLALRMQGGPDEAHIVTDWRPAVSRAEKEHAETIGILRTQVGLPLEEALTLLDYTDDDVRRIVAAARGEQAFAADLVAGDGSATLRAEMDATPSDQQGGN